VNPLIVLLWLGVWLFLAFQAYQRGDTNRALAYVAIGLLFAVLRILRQRARA
jgi:hypothetical protein